MFERINADNIFYFLVSIIITVLFPQFGIFCIAAYGVGYTLFMIKATIMHFFLPFVVVETERRVVETERRENLQKKCEPYNDVIVNKGSKFLIEDVLTGKEDIEIYLAESIQMNIHCLFKIKLENQEKEVTLSGGACGQCFECKNSNNKILIARGTSYVTTQDRIPRLFGGNCFAALEKGTKICFRENKINGQTGDRFITGTIV